MKVAILGVGGIGSTFAVQLARAGHEVTVVARGKRLAQLQHSAGIETAGGNIISVSVSAKLDRSLAWDLVLVVVLASQVDAVLADVAASAARRVMFMFNTFEPLERLRSAVGAERFAFGFPSILARLDERGALQSSIQARGMLTTVTDSSAAEAFTAAGIPSVVSTQMESWLRSHAAAVAPMMLAFAAAHDRDTGISWTESVQLAAAMDEGFRLVRKLGHVVTPTPVWIVSRLPLSAKAALVWASTRSSSIRASGAAGVGEARSLIDTMLATSSETLPELQRVRPASV